MHGILGRPCFNNYTGVYAQKICACGLALVPKRQILLIFLSQTHLCLAFQHVFVIASSIYALPYVYVCPHFLLDIDINL